MATGTIGGVVRLSASIRGYHAEQIPYVTGAPMTVVVRASAVGVHGKKGTIAGKALFVATARAVSFGPDMRLGSIHKPIPISAATVGIVSAFRPNINARVRIGCAAAGNIVIAPRSGYLFAPPIKITATMRGTNAPLVTGKIAATIRIGANLSVNSSLISGYVGVYVPIDFKATGSGYLVAGSLNKRVIVSASALGNQRTAGVIKVKIAFASTIRADATTINSLYGAVKIGVKALATYGGQRGVVAGKVLIKPLAVGQSLDTRSGVFGTIGGKVTIRSISHSRAVVSGSMMSPAVVAIQPGKFKNNAQNIEGAVFEPLRGRAFLAPGVPVPTDFRYGDIRATVVVNAAGTIRQNEGKVAGAIGAPIEIAVTARGTVRMVSGDIQAPVVMRAALMDGIYGAAVAKLNVHGVLSTPEYSITVTKTIVHAMTIDQANAQHVSKAVAYAVLGPTESAAVDSYEAILFF